MEHRAERGPATEHRTSVERPGDFDAFWAEIMAEAGEVPLHPSCEFVPMRSTAEVDVFEIGYDSL